MSEEMRRRDLEREPEDPKQIATGMTLADISIRNHVFAWMLMFALIGFGLICFTGFGTVFRGLGISQNPDVDFPIVNVSVTYEGASPEIMETDVVDTIEDAVTAVEGVKQISSTSRQGSASITIEFELNRNIDAALAGRPVPHRPGRAAVCPATSTPPSSARTTPRTSPSSGCRSRGTGRPPSWPTTSAT